MCVCVCACACVCVSTKGVGEEALMMYAHKIYQLAHILKYQPTFLK